MIRINIFGDFFVNDVSSLQIESILQKQIDEADVNVVNFEAPIRIDGEKKMPKSGPSLSQDPNAPFFLEEHGFNVVSLANNHIMDYGQDSAVQTMSSFEKSITLGTGTFSDAYRVKYLNINSIVIGFISITQYEFGVHGEEIDAESSVGTAWMCHPVVDEMIIEARSKCDFLIILPHAGLEEFEYPLPEICTLYHHWINIGASAVIAGHPHIVQPWEIYNNSPILYSLGNFCFDIKGKKSFWYNGLMAQLLITNDGIKLSTYPINYSVESNMVSLCRDIGIFQIIEEINKTFENKNKYISIVNEKCLSLSEYYNGLYELSGYYRPHFFTYIKLAVKTFVYRYIYKKEQDFDNSTLINNVRCETHRWVQSRIFEQTSNKYEFNR